MDRGLQDQKPAARPAGPDQARRPARPAAPPPRPRRPCRWCRGGHARGSADRERRRERRVRRRDAPEHRAELAQERERRRRVCHRVPVRALIRGLLADRPGFALYEPDTRGAAEGCAAAAPGAASAQPTTHRQQHPHSYYSQTHFSRSQGRGEATCFWIGLLLRPSKPRCNSRYSSCNIAGHSRPRQPRRSRPLTAARATPPTPVTAAHGRPRQQPARAVLNFSPSRPARGDQAVMPIPQGHRPPHPVLGGGSGLGSYMGYGDPVRA